MDYTIRVLKRENTFEHNKEHFEFINDDICILIWKKCCQQHMQALLVY